jgi:hypothetical protein
MNMSSGMLSPVSISGTYNIQIYRRHGWSSRQSSE